MPSGGATARAEHQSRLTRLAHEILISDEISRNIELAESEAEPGSDASAACRVVRREIELHRKIPGELLQRKSRLSSDAYLVWRKARLESDFATMAPFYKALVEVTQEMAASIGYSDHPYDPLHDQYEEGATHAKTKELFDSVRGPITDLCKEASERATDDDAFMVDPTAVEGLRRWSETTTSLLGFDYNRGRLDLTTNAFCSTISRDDVRMTARPKEHLGGVILSSLHEMGHGIYEQNCPAEWDRGPLGGGISLGVHESQSRTWENIVGRSEAFWTYFYGSLLEHVPSLKAVTMARFIRALNKVKVNPVRIGSDEISYNLHIILRFELEADLVAGELDPLKVNEAWNEKTYELLGIYPRNDGEGVLQDVHWSRGSFGYFPTYAMGNFIGWQVWDSLESEIGPTDELIQQGNFHPILGWLTDKIYSQAKRFPPSVLVERVTGKPMEAESYLKGMRARYLG